MTDPIALTTVAAQAAAPGSAAAATAASQAAALPPADTQMFATLMKGATGVAPSAAGTPGGFGTVSTSFVEQWSNTRSFEDIRHSMLQSFDAGDPNKGLFAITSTALEAHLRISTLHS